MTPVEHLVALWFVGTVLMGFLSALCFRDASDAQRVMLARMILTCWAWPLWLLAGAWTRIVWLWRVGQVGTLFRRGEKRSWAEEV